MVTTGIIVVLIVVIIILLLSLIKYVLLVSYDVGSKARTARCWRRESESCVDMDWTTSRRLVCSSGRQPFDLFSDTKMRSPIVQAAFLERKRAFSVRSVAIETPDLQQFAERATACWILLLLKQCKSIIYLCVSVCLWISMQGHFLLFGIATISLDGYSTVNCLIR